MLSLPRILAIDPGTTESGVVVFDPALKEPVVYAGVHKNDEMLGCIEAASIGEYVELSGDHVLALEMIASYGMPVGKEVFETCVWIGRFYQAWGGSPRMVYRREVKQHLCGSVKAKDANVWQALLDRYGGKAAVGTKKNPGPLYGVKSHARAALAVAQTVADGLKEGS